MTELGQRLKEAREAKGITLNQLQEQTKIQKRYLAAIEEGKYDVLPGEFYVKAFIKQYAEAVGISKEELTALQSQSKPQPQPEVSVQEAEPKKEVNVKKEVKAKKEVNEDKPAPMQRRQKPSSSISSSRLMEYVPRILAIVVIIGVLVAVWFGISKLNSNSPQDTNTQQGAGTNNAESDQPDDSPLNADNTTDEAEGTTDGTADTTDEDTAEPEEETATQELTVKETSGNRSTMTLKNADSFVITLTAAEAGESYVEVSNNEGKVYFSGIIKNGQSETIDVSSEDIIELNIGRTLDLSVKINDENMTYPINTSESVHQRITIERIGGTEETS